MLITAIGQVNNQTTNEKTVARGNTKVQGFDQILMNKTKVIASMKKDFSKKVTDGHVDVVEKKDTSIDKKEVIETDDSSVVAKDDNISATHENKGKATENIEKTGESKDDPEIVEDTFVDESKPQTVEINTIMEVIIGQLNTLSEEAVSKIAQLLGVSEEKVKETLQVLDLKVTDLKGPQLLAFVSKVKDIENPLDLLKIEGIGETLKTIPDIANKLNASMDKVVEQLTDQIPKTLLDKVLAKVENILAEKNGVQINLPKIENANEVKSDVLKATFKEVIELPVEKPMGNGEQKNSSQNEQTNKNQNIITTTTGFQNQETIVKTDVFANMVGKSIESQMSQRIDQIDTIRQMVTQIRANITEEATSMTMQLKPAHLGKITVDVVKEQGVLTAKIATENEAVKGIVESNLIKLKQSFEDQGIKVQDVKVTIKYNQDSQQRQEQTDQQPQQNKQNRGHLNGAVDGDLGQVEAVSNNMRREYSSIEYSA